MPHRRPPATNDQGIVCRSAIEFLFGLIAMMAEHSGDQGRFARVVMDHPPWADPGGLRDGVERERSKALSGYDLQRTVEALLAGDRHHMGLGDELSQRIMQTSRSVIKTEKFVESRFTAKKDREDASE